LMCVERWGKHGSGTACFSTSTGSSLYHGSAMTTAKADVVDLMISNNIGCHFSHLA